MSVAFPLASHLYRMCGETLAATVKRLRLHRAADRLANSSMAVAEIAVRAGYGSPEGFGQAFKDAYGKAPADYRSNGSHAAFKAANSTGNAAGFPVSVVTLPKIRCAAVSHTGTYMQIDKAMGTLFGGLAAQGLLTHGTRMIGVFFDDPDMVPVEKLRSMACSPVEADAVPGIPLDATILLGGPHAKLRYRGPYADMRTPIAGCGVSGCRVRDMSPPKHRSSRNTSTAHAMWRRPSFSPTFSCRWRV